LLSPPLANILNHHRPTASPAQINLQRPAKEFEKHLKAQLGYGRIVATFAELITDEGV